METVEARLKRCSLFHGVSAKEVQEIFRDIPHFHRSYYKGSRLFHRGDVYENLMVLIHGEVQTSMEIGPDKSIAMETLRAPDAMAAGVLFAKDNHLPVTATAITDLEVVCFPKKSVLSMLSRYEAFLVNYMEDMGNKIVFLADKIKVLKFATLRQKLASYLLDLSTRQSADTVKLPFSKEALAEVFGVTRPSLSRVFSELTAEGLLGGEGRQVELRDKKSLSKYLTIGD